MTRHILIKSRSRLCGKLESDIMHFCALNPFRLNKGLRTLFRLAFDKKFIIRKDRLGNIFSKADKKLAKVFNKKKSYYGGILLLKKKIRFYFGVIDDNYISDQLYYIYNLKKKVKGLKIMDALARAFEMRLDFLSVRLRYFFSLKEARNYIQKGLFKINGVKVFNAYLRVMLGDILAPISLKSSIIIYKSLYLNFYSEYFLKSGLLRGKFLSSLFKFYLARLRRKVFQRRLKISRYYFIMTKKLKRLRLRRLSFFNSFGNYFCRAWDFKIQKFQTNPIILRSMEFGSSFLMLKNQLKYGFHKVFFSHIPRFRSAPPLSSNRFFAAVKSIFFKRNLLINLYSFYENSILYAFLFLSKIITSFLEFYIHYFKIFYGFLNLRQRFIKVRFIISKLKKKRRRRRFLRYKTFARIRCKFYRKLYQIFLMKLALRLFFKAFLFKKNLKKFIKKVFRRIKKRRKRRGLRIRIRSLGNTLFIYNKLKTHMDFISRFKVEYSKIRFLVLSTDPKNTLNFNRFRTLFMQFFFFKRYFKSKQRRLFISIFLFINKFKMLSRFFFLVLLKTKGAARFKTKRWKAFQKRRVERGLKRRKRYISKFRPFFLKKRRIFFLDISFKKRRVLRLWTIRLIEKLFNIMRFFEFAVKKKIRFYRLRKREFSFFLMGQNYKTRRKFFKKYRRFKAFNYFKFVFFKFVVFMRKRVYRVRTRVYKKRLFYTYRRFRKIRSVFYKRFISFYLNTGKISILNNMALKLRHKYKRRFQLRLNKLKKKTKIKLNRES